MTETSSTGQPQRIDLTHETDVAYWCRILGVSIEELRDAVQHAGPDVGEVQKHLLARAAPRDQPR